LSSLESRHGSEPGRKNRTHVQIRATVRHKTDFAEGSVLGVSLNHMLKIWERTRA